MPNLISLKDLIKSQENVIKSLQNTLQINLKKMDKMSLKYFSSKINKLLGYREIDLELQKLRHDKKLLEEKQKQVFYSFYLNFSFYFLGHWLNWNKWRSIANERLYGYEEKRVHKRRQIRGDSFEKIRYYFFRFKFLRY